MSYLKTHKYHLIAFAFLLLIAGFSGYYTFKTQKTENHIQLKKIDNEQQLSPTNKQDKFSSSTKVFNTPPLSNSQSNTNTQDIPPTQDTTTTIPSSTFQNPIVLTIANEKYITEFATNTTVYELMQKLSASSIKSFSFSGKEHTGLGFFVEEINNTKNNPQTGKYWIYYINNKPAQLGISNYIINKGDIIQWKYESTF